MDETITRFLARIAQAPARALLLDYDGTLAPFRTDPERAFPYPEIPSILQLIVEQARTRLVIVSGRPVAGVKALLHVPRVEIWGCHGLERLMSDGTLERHDAPPESSRALENAARLLMKDGLAPYAERKFASIAIHWRGNENMAEDLAGRVQRAWSALEHRNGLRMLPFDGGIEIALAAKTKGDAVRTILAELGPGSAIAYLGDDTTDEDAFAALHGQGLTVLVREEYRPTVADAWIRPPEELKAFLRTWISAVRSSLA